jgi:hypothetical protein
VTLPPVQSLAGEAFGPQPEASGSPPQHWVSAASVGQVHEVNEPLLPKQQVRERVVLLHPMQNTAIARTKRAMWFPSEEFLRLSRNYGNSSVSQARNPAEVLPAACACRGPGQDASFVDDSVLGRARHVST